MPNALYPYEVNWQIGDGKWFVNPNWHDLKSYTKA